MVIEHGAINIVLGKESEFEAAFVKAATVIATSPGFRFVRVARGIERPSSYLLLVGWDSIDDHVVRFRGSDLFRQWRELITVLRRRARRRTLRGRYQPALTNHTPGRMQR